MFFFLFFLVLPSFRGCVGPYISFYIMTYVLRIYHRSSLFLRFSSFISRLHIYRSGALPTSVFLPFV